MQKCPCGTGKNYLDCCGIYISGQKQASSPEALMRSRYTAFSKADVKYIFATMSSKALKNSDQEATKEWATRCTWLSLEVIDAPPTTDDIGVVEFIVKYIEEDVEHELQERSLFQMRAGRWYYIGEAPKARATMNQGSKNANSKINRNDHCPCGSGKKYKKCCLGQQEVINHDQ